MVNGRQLILRRDGSHPVAAGQYKAEMDKAVNGRRAGLAQPARSLPVDR